MNKTTRISLIHAYLDGQLDRITKAYFTQYLQENPETLAELTELDQLDQHLKTTFSEKPELPVPAKFLNMIDQHLAVQEYSSTQKMGYLRNILQHLSQAVLHPRPLFIYAAIIFSLASTLFLLKFDPLDKKQNQILALAQIQQLVIDAHTIYSLEKRHAVEVDSTDTAHLMKWLSTRLGTQVGPANLDSVGYKLMGGRLLPSRGHPAAFYMYKDNADARITLYINSNQGLARFSDTHCTQRPESLSTCSWFGENLYYTLVSSLPMTSFEPVVVLTVKQLSK